MELANTIEQTTGQRPLDASLVARRAAFDAARHFSDLGELQVYEFKQYTIIRFKVLYGLGPTPKSSNNFTGYTLYTYIVYIQLSSAANSNDE